MANDNASTPTVDTGVVYEFSRTSGSAELVSLPATAPAAHQINKEVHGVNTEVAIPFGSVLTGIEQGGERLAHDTHLPGLGVAARIIGGVVIVNDINNVVQHLREGRLGRWLS